LKMVGLRGWKLRECWKWDRVVSIGDENTAVRSITLGCGDWMRELEDLLR
jgi:hypothetical protein